MHTKIHHMLDAASAGRIMMATPHSERDHVQVRDDQLHIFKNLGVALVQKPLFVFDVDLHREMATSDIIASLSAMQEAGCLSLPFPEMVVETEESDGFGKCRHISLIHELPGSVFRVITWIYYLNDEMAFLPPSGIDASLNLKTGTVEFEVRDTPWMPSFWKMHRDKLQKYLHKTYLIYAGRHVTAALILLNTKGMAKHVVPVEPRLNKKRAKLGRAPIPGYTYINIGTVYDRTGNAIDRTTEAGKRASPRVHLRRAHNRNVRVGKGRTGFRLMHFPAVLVNFDPRTGEGPQQKRYKVKGVSRNDSSNLHDNGILDDPVGVQRIDGGEQLSRADGVL
jgi:hypothetical protein